MKTALDITCAALISCAALGAQAQLLTGAKVNPAEIRAGQSTTLTADFDISSGALLCNVRVHFGDGQTQDFKINQTKDVPLVVSHAYAKPGSYKLMVEGKTALPLLKCTGPNQSAVVNVLAASTTAARPAAAGAPRCPDGWALNAKSVNRKTGAYTCTARANTPLPAGKLACPGGLDYFESARKGQLGCRP